jgi:CBS domain-containing protein
MTNRQLTHVIKDQQPLVASVEDTVRKACREMLDRGAGSVLAVDEHGCLKGIFTGRDAVRLLAKGGDIADLPLAKAMTRDPVTVNCEHRAIDALKVMEQGGFRHVPVLKAERVCGCVSRGDFKGMEFEAFQWHQQGRPAASAMNRSLGEIVSGQKPLWMSPTDTVHEACAKMWKQKLGIVLVVDAKKRLKGVFTGRDAMRALARIKDAAEAPLSKIMTKEPARITPDKSAIDALRAMSDGGFRHLPVVGGERILGVVTRADFTGFEIDRLETEEHLKECLW